MERWHKMNDMKRDNLLETIDEIHEKLYRYIRSRIGNEFDTQDVYQETLKDALSAYDPKRHNTKLRSWLMTIAKNNVITYFRKKKQTESLDDHTDIQASVDQYLLDLYLTSLIEEGFDVPDELLKYLFQSIFSNVPLTEISDKTNIPYTRLRYWKGKMLAELRHRFDNEKFF
jgi:RNA polymerase sigma-70 factor (ECF subfamily)